MSMVAIGWTLLLPAQTGSNTNGIRAIRALRALRPLRTISRFDSLRFVLECFFAVRDPLQSGVACHCMLAAQIGCSLIEAL